MSIKVIDDASLRVLQDAVKLINQRPPYSPTRSPFNPDTPTLDTNSTPEVYVCRVPEGGLPALSLAEAIGYTGTSSSINTSSDLFQVHGTYCAVYQVENVDGVLREVPGNTPYVYNLSSDIIPEDTWILVAKDNYGDWFAIGTSSFSRDNIGTGTGTHEHIGGTPCDSLAMLDSYDCILISTTDPCGNSFITYLTYLDGHWTSEDEFCYIGGSGTFDFYYSAGRFHLLLDGKELLDCGTGCFTGAWITGHWTLSPITGTGVLNTQCASPSFTICVECSCCPIDGWEGPGLYCIYDTNYTGTGNDNHVGTGSNTACEPVMLDDSDKCDDSIIICSGPYGTIAEVLAACGPVIPTPTTGTGIGSSTGTTSGIITPCCPLGISSILQVTGGTLNGAILIYDGVKYWTGTTGGGTLVRFSCDPSWGLEFNSGLGWVACSCANGEEGCLYSCSPFMYPSVGLSPCGTVSEV